ncbi:site-specific integrase [Halobacteriaceae archaeon SHR40]|uniref:site-specific integrase n=1 Tax=Halovenus amylolytica TaxID=2500550 RepID=UPI000FE2D902
MQTERTKDGRRKLWMTQNEYEDLVESIDDEAKQIAVQIMGESGLRVGEVTNIRYKDISRADDGEHYLLTVRGTKDTTGEYENGKERQTLVPIPLERDIFKYHTNMDRGNYDPIFSIQKRTIQNWIKEVGENMAEETGKEVWEELKPHDLRRYFAHLHGDIRGVNVRVLMSVGGWDSYEAIKPYLAKPSEENIIDEMSE